jgi:saccharopine dehydrogenase-like NADP-dependent oxidoreductase
MTNHRIVVIGAAGGMARVGLQRLSSIRDDLTFELYDLDVERLNEVEATLPGDRVTTGQIDLFDESALRRTIDGASMVLLGAGPYLKTAPPVMRACIEAGVDYIDFDDDVESTLDGLELDNQARAAGVALFLGCGASPGLSNVMAVDAAGQLDRAETVEVCWVSGDEGPYPLGAAVLEHAIHIGAGDTLVWREGRQLTVPSFVENDVFPMGGVLGDYRLYLTAHPEAVTLPRVLSGVRSVRVMGGLHPQPVNGVIRGVSLAVKDGKLTLAEAVRWFQAVMQDKSGSLKVWQHALAGMFGQVRRDEATLGEMGSYLWQGLRKHHVPFLAGILVRATGARNGEPATVIRRTSTGGPGTFMGSSMANATGTCLAAFAHLALEQKSRLAGVLNPEDWVEPERYYATLEGLGVPREEFFGEEATPSRVT